MKEIKIPLSVLGNWCEVDIGDHYGYNDSPLPIEAVESVDDDDDDDADLTSSFKILGDWEEENWDGNESEDNGESEHGTCSTLQQRALNYLVKIKEENRIPQRTVENIAFATSWLFQGALHNLQRCLTETLQSANIVLEDITEVTECFKELSDCFDGLAKGWLPGDGELPCVVGKHQELMWQGHSTFPLLYVYRSVTSHVIYLCFYCRSQQQSYLVKNVLFQSIIRKGE